tara:strand:- start:53 stop:1162 length:1110 start_codon:yes stop_codon:yes gene_type:complete
MTGTKLMLMAAAGAGGGAETVSLYTWGRNNVGQLGQGDAVTRSVPTVLDSFVAPHGMDGSEHNAFIDGTGALWTWGANNSGQLGQGDAGATARSSPVQVGALTDWSLTATGSANTFAIKTDGTLWGIGQADSGALGDGTVVHKSSPIQIGVATNWATVATSGLRSAAIDTDGKLFTWGSNTGGDLGLSNGTNMSVPTQVGALTDWSAISCGASGGMVAIKTDNTAWGWGTNSNNFVGLAGFASSPVQIGALTDWSTITLGASSWQALKTDGTWWAGGTNDFGQMGTGNVVSPQSSPVQQGVATDWIAVDASNFRGFAVNSGGLMWGIGNNTLASLGDGTVISRSSVVQVQGTGWIGVKSGTHFTVGWKA